MTGTHGDDCMCRNSTLREMVEAMSRSPDNAVFRWYQTSVVSKDGVPVAGETLCVTVGQARAELGLGGQS